MIDASRLGEPLPDSTLVWQIVTRYIWAPSRIFPVRTLLMSIPLAVWLVGGIDQSHPPNRDKTLLSLLDIELVFYGWGFLNFSECLYIG